MNPEEIEARSQKWYAEHGWIPLACQSNEYRIGDQIRSKFAGPHERFLEQYRWRVVASGRRLDCVEMAKFVFGRCATQPPSAFTHFYRIEAMD